MEFPAQGFAVSACAPEFIGGTLALALAGYASGATVRTPVRGAMVT